MAVLAGPTDLQTCNTLASLEDRAPRVLHISRLRARSGTEHVSKYSATLNIFSLTQSSPALSRGPGGIGFVLSINSLDCNNGGLAQGIEPLQLDSKTRSRTRVSLCVTASLETFLYYSYPYFRCGLGVFGVKLRIEPLSIHTHSHRSIIPMILFISTKPIVVAFDLAASSFF